MSERGRNRPRIIALAIALPVFLVALASGGLAHDGDKERDNSCADLGGHGFSFMLDGDHMEGFRMHRMGRDARHLRHLGERLEMFGMDMDMDMTMGGFSGFMPGGRFMMRHGGGGDSGHGELTRGIVTDQTVRKIDRNSKEVTTVRRTSNGDTTTVTRLFKKTDLGVEVTGTVALPDGETESFAETFAEGKNGSIVFGRSFTDAKGRTRSFKRSVRTDDGSREVEIEVTRPDGTKSSFKRVFDKDNDSERTTVIRGIDDQHSVTITRSSDGDTRTIVVTRPDGTTHTITRPCGKPRPDEE